jgi:hypothetical protein
MLLAGHDRVGRRPRIRAPQDRAALPAPALYDAAAGVA